MIALIKQVTVITLMMILPRECRNDDHDCTDHTGDDGGDYTDCDDDDDYTDNDRTTWM